MNLSLMIELIGYLGSTLVVISMLMSNVKKLRIINTTGSTIFAIYALIIHSYPTAIMNFCLVAINLYNIKKLGNTEKTYELVPTKLEDGFLQNLLNRYQDDIDKYIPEWETLIKMADLTYIITCDSVPAGIFAGKKGEDGEIDAFLDYSTPAYRDCSVGDFLYKKLKEMGYKTLVFTGKNEAHEVYLKKMGFALKDTNYVKEL